MRGFVTNRMPDPDWPGLTVVRVLPGPTGDPWGALGFVRGTAWEGLFPVVAEGPLDAALRGYSTPLVRALGLAPGALLKRVPAEHRGCAHRNSCITAGPACVPGPKVPDCWEAPAGAPGAPGPERQALEYAVRSWREGAYVVVVAPRP